MFWQQPQGATTKSTKFDPSSSQIGNPRPDFKLMCKNKWREIIHAKSSKIVVARGKIVRVVVRLHVNVFIFP